MQTLLHKNTIIILFFSLLTIQLTYSQSIEKNIIKADSLFSLKQYTQAYDLYEGIYSKSKVYSPQMLLKMAFIQEGLDNYTTALYHLNNYYSITHDKKVLQKIEKLADKYRLKGYEYSDLKFFVRLYTLYQLQITLGFALIAFALLLITFYEKYKKNEQVRVFAFLNIALVVLFLSANLFFNNRSSGIVSENTYLMSGPSAGADVIETLSKGNKIEVLEEDLTWLKVNYNNKKGFIRTTTMLSLGY